MLTPRWWCRLMHPRPMWPINGRYQCPACQRVTLIGFEQEYFRQPRPEPVGVLEAEET
jgi:hypothetical protein